MLSIQREATVAVNDFHQLLVDSTLGERRPVSDLPRLAEMVAHSNLIVTARDGTRLVGIARSVTDFAYCCYLSDLAVARSHQSQGVGRALIEKTRESLHPDASLILLSAPAAVEYYPKVGFERHPAAFVRRRGGSPAASRAGGG